MGVGSVTMLMFGFSCPKSPDSPLLCLPGYLSLIKYPVLSASATFYVKPILSLKPSSFRSSAITSSSVAYFSAASSPFIAMSIAASITRGFDCISIISAIPARRQRHAMRQTSGVSKQWRVKA